MTACLIVACAAKEADEVSSLLWGLVPNVMGVEESPTLDSSLFLVPKEFDVLEFGSAAAEKFSKWLSSSASQRDQIFLKVFLESSPTLAEQKQLELGFTHVCKLVSWVEVPEQDYVAKFREHFKGSLTPSKRIWVGPVWEQSPVCEMSLRVEPGMAFGTGDHPTTQMCLDRILEYRDEQRLMRGLRVLDLGCGTGILALALKKLEPQANCLLTDLDPLCGDQVERTFALNGVSVDSVTTIFGPKGALSELKDFGPFDLIVSNIYAEILAALAADIFKALRPGALWLCSGILSGSADEALVQAAQAQTFVCKLKRSVVKASQETANETWVLREFEKPKV